jgi:aminoglycoside 6'-N-acetyltransferase I
MKIEPIVAADLNDWVALREVLWPGSVQEHKADAKAALNDPTACGFIARTPDGIAAGFAEGRIRHDDVNGCETTPVGYLKGIYVRSAYRGKGVARELIQKIENWVKGQGCREFASETSIENLGSQEMHTALGFEETERVVFFRKLL